MGYLPDMLARLVLVLACCPHWGDMGALGLFTIDDIGELTVVLWLSSGC